MYVGRESSLLTIPQAEEDEHTVSYEDRMKDHSYPTIVRSIGDFPTIAGQKAEEGLNYYFDELSLFIEKADPTVTEFRKLLDKVEGYKGKEEVNSVKVYFPSSAGVPGGFRPIGERGLGYSLTYTVAKQHETFWQTGEFTIKNREMLEIHPLVTLAPIMFEDQNPVLLSMIPGQGHHFLKALTLANQEKPLDFISRTMNFHTKNKLQVSKGFFIGTLKEEASFSKEEALGLKKEVFEEVALLLTPNGCQCAYRSHSVPDDQQAKYYFTDGKMVKPITANQHALFCRRAAEATEAKEAAIRATSAGQETELLFQEAITGNSFWSSKTSAFRDFIFSIENNPSSKIEGLLEKMDLSQEEKGELVTFLLEKDHLEAALKIFKAENLDPNLTSLEGIPLVFYAIEKNDINMLDYLLQKGVKLDVRNPKNKGNTPLHEAVSRENQPIVERLLKEI